jgi:hypothetical protein
VIVRKEIELPESSTVKRRNIFSYDMIDYVRYIGLQLAMDKTPLNRNQVASPTELGICAGNFCRPPDPHILFEILLVF